MVKFTTNRGQSSFAKNGTMEKGSIGSPEEVAVMGFRGKKNKGRILISQVMHKIWPLIGGGVFKKNQLILTTGLL